LVKFERSNILLRKLPWFENKSDQNILLRLQGSGNCRFLSYANLFGYFVQIQILKIFNANFQRIKLSLRKSMRNVLNKAFYDVLVILVLRTNEDPKSTENKILSKHEFYIRFLAVKDIFRRKQFTKVSESIFTHKAIF
jgi:hypothetical protein